MRSDQTTPMRTIFLASGRTSAIHRHAEDAAWFHVVSGEIVEERWTRDAEGGFVHERRRLRTGQSLAAPTDTLHRIAAVGDAVFVTTCLCACTRARPAPSREVDAVMRLLRTGSDSDWASATATGEPSPSGAPDVGGGRSFQCGV